MKEESEKRLLNESGGQEELIEQKKILTARVDELEDELDAMKEEITRLEGEVEMARNPSDAQRLDALLEQSKNFEVRNR